MDQGTRDFIQFKELKTDEPGQISTLLYIDEKLPSFAGHFPGNPVLPAVSIIDISLLLISQVQSNVSFSKIQVEKSRFTAMVRPQQTVRIEAHSADNKTWKVTWISDEDQSKLAQVQLVI